MSPTTPQRPRFFKSVNAFGRWLAKSHATSTELHLGLYKKHAAHRGMTYPEAVEEAPSYQHAATHWVVSAKKEETRARRLAQLIAHSAEGKKLRQFTPLDQRDR